MGIFDIFTGQPAIAAAGQQRGALQGAQGEIGNIADLTRRYNQDTLQAGYGGARNDLGTGYGAATGAIGQGYTDARGQLGQGYGAATGAINAGAGGALGYLDQGQAGARDALAGARSDLTANGGAFAPLSALAGRYGQGAGLYADSLGINGPQGTQRAQGAFTAGPGYNFMVDQGIDAINRRRNAAGSLVGGNADRDAQLFGQGAAKQEFGGWQDRLAGFNPLELSATQGAAAGNAGINQNLAQLGVTGANLSNIGGQNRAGVAVGQGNTLADTANRYYGGQAGLDTAQGGTLANLANQYYGGRAGLDTGEAGALTGNMNNASGWLINSQMGLTPQIGKTFQDEANASLQGTGNLWKLGIAGATAAAGGLGGGFGGGFGGGSFGGMGGNLGAAGVGDPSMWNKSLPVNGFNW